MAAAPRSAYVIPSSGTQLLWSDGSYFDGFILIALNSGQTQPYCYLDNADYVQRLPQYTKIRVTAGIIDPTQRLYFTADIQPPNSRYWAWFYDLTGTLIYPTVGNPSAFTVTTDPHPLTIQTLTVPTAPSTPPSTIDPVVVTVTTAITFVDNETPGGSITSTNGTNGNGVFTLAQTPSPAASLQLFKNGVLQVPATDYNLSGSTITYVSGRYPVTGDIHRASYRYAT